MTALKDIRVLDLSRVLAGPYCTQLLGDFGADIIKVEIPGRGDDTRAWGPPWAGGESAYYLSANRNKRSITLNLKHPKGKEILYELVSTSDIVVENFKVGAAKKLAIDYETLRAHNPKIIYCSITGYGQTGPYRHRPGYDFVIQAQGGLMSITGPADGQPHKVGVAIADITTGLFASSSILAALHHRENTGEGQYIDLALLDTQVAWLANVAQNYLVSGKTPGRYGNAHPNIVPYQPFATKNGHIALGVGNDDQFKRFCKSAGRMDIWEDDRFKTNPSRTKHREELVPILEKLFLEKNSGEWIDLLLEVGIPVGPINTVPQIFSDPQIEAREMVRKTSHPTAGAVKSLGPVPKLSRTPPDIHRHPPTLGEHTSAILTDIIGLNPEEIKELKLNV